MSEKISKNGKKLLTGGRVTKSNKELLDRRCKEYELWARGVSKCEIARQFNLSMPAVIADIKAIAALEPVQDIKEKIDAGFKELVAICFTKITDAGVTDTAKIGYIREALEGFTRLARIHGLDRGDTYTFNQTSIITGVQIYDKWDDSRIQEEYKRRRLTIQSSPDGEGEEKL